MKNIKLTIKNITDTDYKFILLRKFFCMVFFDDKGKKADVFIATVFGGMSEDKKNDNILCPNYKGTPCSLKFEFSSDSDLIDKDHLAITDLTESFWEQSTWISSVWGECQKKERQSDISELLKNVYTDEYSGNISVPTINVDAHWPFYYICDKSSADTHTCIVSNGDINIEEKQCQYTLSVLDKNLVNGIEVMNWVKTEIPLRENILDDQISMTIELDGKNGAYYTPDFTWYFAPPYGYEVNQQDATLQYGSENESRNKIQHVSDTTTVRFKEWDEAPYSILTRNKSRIIELKEELIKDPLYLSNHRKIRVSFKLQSDSGVHSNRQFIIGLIVAFLISFCADKTRMNDYYSCLQSVCSCGIEKCKCQWLCDLFSFLLPIAAVLAFVSLIFKTDKVLPAKMNRGAKIILSVLRLSGMTAAIILCLYMFVFWPIILPKLSIDISCQMNRMILWIILSIGMISNIIYIVFCAGKLKLKIWNYL